MKSYHKPILCSITAILMAFEPARPVRAQTPDAASVLAAAKAASGGDAWDDVHTLHTTAVLSQGGLTGRYEEWDDVTTGRNEASYSLGPGTGAQGYDGKITWNQDQTGQSRVVSDADSREVAVSNAYMVGLAYWFPERLPAAVAYARRVTEHNRSFDVLSIAPTDGYPFELWIDAVTHLIDRTVEPMAEQTQTTYYSDYRLVSGVMLPFANTQSTGQARYDQTTTVQTIAVNAAVPDARFATPPPPAPNFMFENGKTSTTVPFRYLGDHIYFDIAIDGQGPFSAVFDTGGAYVLSTMLAKRLGLKPRGATQGGGSGENSVDMALSQAKDVRFGGIRMMRPIFYVISLPFLKKNPIVGYELFDKFVVRIDYEKCVLTFTRPDRFVYTGTGTVVPFRFNNQTPEVDGVVDGIPGVFTIDTGAGDSLSLTTPFVGRHRLIAKYKPRYTTISGYGVGGAEHSAMTRVHVLNVGGVAARGLVAELSLDKAGSDANKALAGNIGEGFLHRFNLIFDYSRQKIIFEKNSHYDEPDIENRSGLTLDAADGSGLVVAVVPGGPAAWAGIRVGDTLVSLDGQRVSTLPFGGVKRIFQRPVGTRIRARVLRGKRVRTVMVVLKNLI